MLVLLALCVAAAATASAPTAGFVTANGSRFELDGREFKFGGTNVVILQYADRYQVDDVLSRAAANNFSVVRTFAGSWWGGMTSNECSASGADAQYRCWNATSGTPSINMTSVTTYLDYAVAAAAARGLRLVMNLVNNWDSVSTYVTWRTRLEATPAAPFVPYHDSFFTDRIIMQWFKDYITALANHVNVLTGVAYKDEPAIFAWQLGNELRCAGSSGGYNQSAGCVINGTSPLLTAWVDEMSRFIHALDGNHLVSVGDEGCYCADGPAPVQVRCPPNQWWCNCATGDDTMGFLALPGVDYGTFHAYPEDWDDGGMGDSWIFEWMKNHTAQAHALGKPAVMEEFGNHSALTQHDAYANWTAFAEGAGINGWGFWQLANRDDTPGNNGGWLPGSGLNVDCATAADPPPPATHDARSCAVLHAAALSIMGDVADVATL